MRQHALAFLILVLGAGVCVSATLGDPAAPSKKAVPSLKKTPAAKKASVAPAAAKPVTSVQPGQKTSTPSGPKKAGVPPPPASTQGTGNLEDMEVTGQAKDKVMIEKVTPDVKVDVKELVDSLTDKTEKLLEQGRPIPSEEDFRQFDRIDSAQTARPWLPDLVEPPLISFQPAPAQATVVAWRLEVTDDKGDVVHVIPGKGNPVHEIVWEGRDKNGKMIRVASAYAFRFITVDEFKDTHTTLGKAFTLRHLKYKDKKNLIVELSSSYLFADTRISPDALPIFERVLDVLREYSGSPFSLEFQTMDYGGETVKARQKGVTEKIAADLFLSPDSINFSYAPVGDRGDVLRFVIKLR
ncbi:MAG: hypothetical protein IPN90_09470 [Elusimicrobia bacterium]|nr:hypothetical protein [Elusimicrobiota bacterium]